MKKLLLVTFLFSFQFFMAQVGINTTSPNAQLDIQSTNQAAPSNTDGILIPKIDVFPASNPTAAQQGMMVYLTTATTFSGNPKPIGFYFWNDSPADWIAVQGTDGGTLDQAYDFGSSGAGRTITADAGAVLINGTDGLVSTGTPSIGAVAPVGAGARMVWNPRKVAFRAGFVSGSQWDDINIGPFSSAFGQNCIASGQHSFATGFANTASGTSSAAFGQFNIASGGLSAAFGINTTASGNFSTALGRVSSASGENSFVQGINNSATSFGETVLGIGATLYSTSLNGATQFRAANLNDRLFVVGNAIDSNNSGFVDTIERSDAMVILKNGNIGIGSSTPQDKFHVVGNLRLEDGNQASGKVLTSDINGTATWQNASTNAWGLIGNSGTNPATNFVGTTDAQPLRFRVANTFAGNISNITNGLVSLGLNAGSSNTGLANTFIGGTAGLLNTSGASNTFIGQGAGAANTTTSNNTYLGTGAGQSNATGSQNVYVGRLAGGNGISGSDNILIGNGAGILNTANNNVMIGSFAGNGSTTGGGNTFLGNLVGIANSTGGQNTFIGASAGSVNSTGSQNTLVGNGATLNANNLTNATAIGRASRVDVNDGLVLGSVNGVNAATSTSLVGIGTTAPVERLHVVGNIRMVDGNQGAGRVLTCDLNGTATWQNASNNAWGLTGNSGLNASTHFMGTSDDVDVVFKRNGILAGRIASSNTSLGVSAASAITTGVNNNAIGNLALSANTFGNDNNAFGTGSLRVNVGGIRNSAFGSFALDNAVGDSQNSAFGAFVLGNNNGGESNSGLGYNALNANSTGSNNTAMGVDALQINTTGANNTAVGFNAFATINQGSNNTGIGVDTATTSTLTSNATAVGYKATVGASNCVVLGSVNGINGATSSVNVGIGTISPTTALEVVDTNVVTSATVEGTINVMTNGPQAIDAGGSVTLGGTFTDAGTTFRTFGSIEARKANATTNSSSGYLILKTNNAGTLGERMRITNAGDVGIGTVAPGGQFELSLNEGRKPTSNTWIIPSDARLKNVNGIYEKGLAEILQLKPIRYNYKNTDKRTFDPKVLDREAFGFLAQEVQTIFPEAVGTDPDGYLNFDLHPILIASVNALKELNAQNTQLKNENKTLRSAMQQMEQKVALILSEIENLKK